MEMAYAINEQRVIDGTGVMPPQWEEAKTAGDDWYYSFMHRHPSLSLRKPESLGRHQAIMGNDKVLTR